MCRRINIQTHTYKYKYTNMYFYQHIYNSQVIRVFHSFSFCAQTKMYLFPTLWQFNNFILKCHTLQYVQLCLVMEFFQFMSCSNVCGSFSVINIFSKRTSSHFYNQFLSYQDIVVCKSTVSMLTSYALTFNGKLFIYISHFCQLP